MQESRLCQNYGAEENSRLIDHLSINTEAFLAKHPDGLVIVTGDFYPTSTGTKAQAIKQKTGLCQMVTVLTRDTGTLDWALTNRPKLFQPPVQLPKTERSDHFAVLTPPAKSLDLPRTTLETVLRRDMRPSCFNALGRWMTSFDWACILQLTSVQ